MLMAVATTTEVAYEEGVVALKVAVAARDVADTPKTEDEEGMAHVVGAAET